MFNNIIYFIVIILTFSISQPDKTQESSVAAFFIFLFFLWVIFALFCRLSFSGLIKQISPNTEQGRLTAQYHDLVAKLSILAILLFALAVFVFNLKFWIQAIPGFRRFDFLQGMLALSLFFCYLCTIWYFAYPAYNALLKAGFPRKSFILSNIRLNVPIVFPWLALSLAEDLISLSSWPWAERFFNTFEGQLLFFSSFLIILMIFMPRFIQYWWGCSRVADAGKDSELVAFLHEKGFRYRELLKWPIFEGRMLTAGIMGIVPRYRYILVTDALLESLNTEELKAVLAHEMGHARYRHFYFYVLFFIGYMVFSSGMFDILFYSLLAQPFYPDLFSCEDSGAASLSYLILSLPMLLSLLIYFRFVLGFFMRNFERQADLFSAVTMGTPSYTIGALEKIAFLSGKSRNVPSWHHFSIRERVDCLWRTLKEPALIRRHNRFVAVSFLVYLGFLIGLGYFLNFSETKENWIYHFAEKVLRREIAKKSDDLALRQDLAMIYHQRGRYEQAMEIYETVLRQDPNQAVALNNLAWLLVTSPQEELRDEHRALELAKKAVGLERSPVFLDTLAEAYYANGLIGDAVRTIEEAISLATEDRGYYERQLDKFLASRG